jgi:hypothetical protein
VALKAPADFLAVSFATHISFIDDHFPIPPARSRT